MKQIRLWLGIKPLPFTRTSGMRPFFNKKKLTDFLLDPNWFKEVETKDFIYNRYDSLTGNLKISSKYHPREDYNYCCIKIDDQYLLYFMENFKVVQNTANSFDLFLDSVSTYKNKINFDKAFLIERYSFNFKNNKDKIKQISLLEDKYLPNFSKTVIFKNKVENNLEKLYKGVFIVPPVKSTSEIPLLNPKQELYGTLISDKYNELSAYGLYRKITSIKPFDDFSKLYDNIKNLYYSLDITYTSSNEGGTITNSYFAENIYLKLLSTSSDYSTKFYRWLETKVDDVIYFDDFDYMQIRKEGDKINLKLMYRAGRGSHVEYAYGYGYTGPYPFNETQCYKMLTSPLKLKDIKTTYIDNFIPRPLNKEVQEKKAFIKAFYELMSMFIDKIIPGAGVYQPVPDEFKYKKFSKITNFDVLNDFGIPYYQEIFQPYIVSWTGDKINLSYKENFDKTNDLKYDVVSSPTVSGENEKLFITSGINTTKYNNIFNTYKINLSAPLDYAIDKSKEYEITHRNQIDVELQQSLVNSITSSISSLFKVATGVATAIGTSGLVGSSGVAGGAGSFISTWANHHFRKKAIEAKLKDLTQEKVSLLSSTKIDSVYYSKDYLNKFDELGIRVLYLLPDEEYLTKLEYYFRIFGYEVNELTTINNIIDLNEEEWEFIYLKGADLSFLNDLEIPQPILKDILSTFDKGFHWIWDEWTTNQFSSYNKLYYPKTTEYCEREN